MKRGAIALGMALGACAHTAGPMTPHAAPTLSLTAPRAVAIAAKAAPKAHCAAPVAPALPDPATAGNLATGVDRLQATIRRQAGHIRRLTGALKDCR